MTCRDYYCSAFFPKLANSQSKLKEFQPQRNAAVSLASLRSSSNNMECNSDNSHFKVLYMERPYHNRENNTACTVVQPEQLVY